MQKAIYEIQTNKTTQGSKLALYKVANAACDIKLEVIEDSTRKFIKCDQIYLYQNPEDPTDMNIACGWFQNISTDNGNLTAIRFIENAYSYNAWFNSNGEVFSTRWYLGEHKEVSPQTVQQMHLVFYADSECAGDVMSMNEAI